MAGILDSDFMRFLTNNSGYWEQKDQAKAAEQFQGLLGGLEQQGPVQPGQGLLGARSPDEQFWLKAAAIPGYQGLAGQQLGYGAAGNQAMQRQVQQQGYEAGNLSLAQRIQLELQQKRDAFAEQIGIGDLQRKWYGTQASAGAAGAAAQNSQQGSILKGLQIDEALNKAATAQGPLINQLVPADQLKARQMLLRNNAAVDSTLDVLDWAQNRPTGSALPGVGSGKGAAMLTDWKMATMPVMKDIFGSGALDEGERDWYEKLGGDPSKTYLTESDMNMMKTIGQKVQDYSNQQYQALGLEPPKTRGRGAVSRATSVQPKGALKPYQPPGLLGRGQ